MPLCFPPSGRAAVDMQPSPRGFSSPQGPSPKLLCAGHAPKPLTRMSAHCWSLDENLSCSPQHNVAIIAPLQENDTCLLVHSGPRKADRDLSGSCWEKESFTDGWKLLLLSDLQFLLQGRGCYLHPGFRASGLRLGRQQGLLHWLYLEEKDLLFSCPHAARSPPPPFGSFLQNRAPLAPSVSLTD